MLSYSFATFFIFLANDNPTISDGMDFISSWNVIYLKYNLNNVVDKLIANINSM